MYDNWGKLEESIENCNKCKLCENRKNIIFGAGNKNADIMLIGEGPRSRRGYSRKIICRKSRAINGQGISSIGYKKRRNIYN